MTLKILVIDDSSNVHKVVNLAFSGEDAHVEAVTEGGIAIDIVKDFKPDIVLVDVFMPGCNGYEICGRIKEERELGNIPVVLLVGALEPFDEQEAARAGADGFLTKPFNTSDLLKTVHSLCEKRQNRQELNGESCSMAVQEIPTGETTPDHFRLYKRVTPAVRESFLGENRILDLFDRDQLNAAKGPITAGIHGSEQDAKVQGVYSQVPEVDVYFSENTLNRIVDAVMRRMSAEAIREVAWEVVPELSENIIRRTLEERQKS